jgi:hypothetical protein
MRTAWIPGARRRRRSRSAVAWLTGAGLVAAGLAGTGAETFAADATPVAGPAPAMAVADPARATIYLPGTDIPLRATGDARDVASVAFYASTGTTDDTLIGSTSGAPWTTTWRHAPAGDYSLTVVTTDRQGRRTTSEPVSVTVEPPTVVIGPSHLTVLQGRSSTVGVALSARPAAPVTVSLAETGADLRVTGPRRITFTPADWNVPRQVAVAAGTDPAQAGGATTISASASGYAPGRVTVTEAAAASGYDQWFLDLYTDIKNTANGYFSPKGIPYHSVETLIVEAPDYGHETTSETYSYWLWLEADYGRVSGDWTGFTNAWTNLETYMIPSSSGQPGQSTYNPAKPATYGPEEPYPNNYPVALNSSVPVGSDPLSAELRSAYGSPNIYAPSWIMDTDNRYGFGQCEDGTSTPSWINSYQRGPMESVWDTIPQPDCDKFGYGGPHGFLDLFNDGGGSYAQQYKYTDAPDADARLVQAAYWADTYATAQGKTSTISATLGKAAEIGDYLRYAMYDKYFKRIGNCLGATSCPGGTSKATENTSLLSWYYAWGGAADGSWSWRIGGSATHQGYQNPLAAYALSTDADLTPKSPTAKADWATSLTTQLQFYQWLQSAEGAIAGGATNNWGGNYGDVTAPPAGDATFNGMYYDPQPEYHNPPSNQWFGYQTWPMERVAEYYYVTGNATARAILDKWVSWAESVTTADPTTGTLTTPGTLTWSGQPASYTSSATPPGPNPNLHVSVSGTSTDLGVAGSLAKVLAYYAARSGNTTAQTEAQNIIDIIHKYHADSIGYSAPETRTDYKNFTSPYNTTNYTGVYIPSGWSGTYPGGIALNSSTNTFLSIRPWYTSDPQWSKVQTYLNGGAAPVFDYHRFWAEVDIATAFDAFAQLFPGVAPPAGF